MTDQPFVPIVYTKQGCPFSFKLRLFLLEAGLLDSVRFHASADEEPGIRAELEAAMGKVSFPTVQFRSGEYVSDSAVAIARFARESNVDVNALPTYRIYEDAILKMIVDLYQKVHSMSTTSQT